MKDATWVASPRERAGRRRPLPVVLNLLNTRVGTAMSQKVPIGSEDDSPREETTMVRFRVWMVVWAAFLLPSVGALGVELETGTLNPAERCGECHEEIYSMWKNSLHSNAATDPVFVASYVQAYWETAGEARDVCLPCHAPGALLGGDRGLQNPLSQEGITCDYCHSVVAVDLERRHQPFDVRLDGVKRGPIADTESGAHEVAQSELHESSEFCAGCHEYTNAHGMPVFSTYTEWKASPQATAGKTCQECHMPLTPGNTVHESLGVKRSKINMHNISGGHSREQVQRAASVKILGVERRTPTRALVQVEVANIGSGHSIPTGMPTRRLILDVVVTSGGREVERFRRIYEKRLLDEQGRLIVEDHRAILHARELESDNRLRPGERRVEQFSARVPAEGALSVEATLRYSYEPEILMRRKISIEMTSDRFSGGS